MTVPTIGPSRVPIPPIKTMNIIATTQLGSNAKPGATYSVALKLTAPASPVPAADTTNAMKRLRHTSTPMLVAARSLSRTVMSPRPTRDLIKRYVPTMAPPAMATLSQNVTGSSHRAATRRAVRNPIPRSPPSHSLLDTTSDTISENTHIPIAKYASRSRKRKSAITAATPAQTSSASGSTQYGATLNDIDAKNNEYAPSPTNTCCPIDTSPA